MSKKFEMPRSGYKYAQPPCGECVKCLGDERRFAMSGQQIKCYGCGNTFTATDLIDDPGGAFYRSSSVFGYQDMAKHHVIAQVLVDKRYHPSLEDANIALKNVGLGKTPLVAKDDTFFIYDSGVDGDVDTLTILGKGIYGLVCAKLTPSVNKQEQMRVYLNR